MSGDIRDVLIEVSPGEVRVAVLDGGGALRAFHVERMGDASLAGAICLGRVARLEKATQSAFIDIGGKTPAFLARAKGVREGQTLLVQVSRDSFGDKGPAVTRAVSLPGRYLVLRPTESGLHWPKSMPGRVRKSVEEALRNCVRDDNGLTVRSNSALAGPGALAAEAERLRGAWSALEAQVREGGKPGPLRPAPRLIDRVLTDYAPTGGLVLDDRVLVGEIARRLRTEAPDLRDSLALHDDRAPLFESAGVEDQIETCLSRRVPLPRGGSLVIDELEALTAIDVNMGGAGTGRSSEDAVMALNRAAASEAARQVMVRNIAGLIVVDFVSMRNKGNRRRLVEAMRRAFAPDRVTVDVLGMTPAGLIEVTRQRRGSSLAAVMLDSRRSDPPMRPEAVACAALRAALRSLGGGRPVLRCAPAVAEALEGTLRPAWGEASRRLGRDLTVQADPACPRYAIERERRS